MDFNEVVKTRRSVRGAYEKKEVDKEILDELFKCVQYAPSWKNSQTGRYYVAKSDEAAKKLRNAIAPFNRNNSENATLIATTFVTNRAGFEKDGTPTNEAGNCWGAYDLGLQAMVLCLKAKEMGLDTLIMGIRDAGAIKETFNIPDDEMVMSVIAVGYSDAEPAMPPRKELSEVVKYL
ncbi:MAG: nitroreductase family protein [Clostridiales bacterium]|nr:nitroreductase family protein [Clostridiales bacterium]